MVTYSKRTIYRILLPTIICIALLPQQLGAQSSSTVQQFIERYKDIALKFEADYGIPAPITLAQAILESGAGTSSLTKASNNYFCIKAPKGWNGPIYLAKDDEIGLSRFRVYGSAEESFKDYAHLLSTSGYYRDLFKISIYNYRGWAHGLKKAGYATAPHYANSLIGIIERYKLYALNGGVKLKPGKTVTIVKYVENEVPVFDDECIQPDDIMTEEEEEIADAKYWDPILINDVPCTAIKPGEDLSSISRKHDIPLKNLLEYNDLAKKDYAKEGSIIFLEKKKKKYEGAQDVYIAKEGESLYLISQKFGIRLTSLAKINHIDEYSRVKPGTKIALK